MTYVAQNLTILETVHVLKILKKDEMRDIFLRKGFSSKD